MLPRIYVLLSKIRYWLPRVPVPKQSREDFLHLLDDGRFKDEMCMSRSAFHSLLGLISPDPLFITTSIRKPMTIQLQLTIALCRFGHSGNASAIGQTARFWGVSEGSVVNATKRVIVAIWRLRERYLYWPRAEERREISRRVEEASGFPSCIGFVDGTHIPLYHNPVKDGSDYFNRKMSYSLAAMI
ncbi:hypothetical protein DFS34DRAFT_710922, partial [Phlyctochytrium arcticum]